MYLHLFYPLKFYTDTPGGPQTAVAINISFWASKKMNAENFGNTLMSYSGPHLQLRS